MQFSDKTRFWVIFDTCTRREYYQDVHNLLAEPEGSTLRYEYRQKYLSSDAEKAARNPESAPSIILLIYAQWSQYIHGNAAPEPSTPSSEILWAPTRLAQMQLIPKPEGVNFFFDFRVLGYPKLDMEGLMKILDPLIQAKEVPFNKWVSLSRDVEALASLQKGRDNENWQSLVDYLGSSPMQFSHDSFFRLKGPFHGSKGRKLLPTYIEAKQAVNGGLEIRKVVSLYDVHENDSLSIEVTSHSPHRSEEQEILSGIAKRNLSLEVEKDAPLSILGDKSVDLRQYTGQIVTLKAKRCEELDEKTGIVRFNTNLGPDEWPTGASFFLTFRIKKRTIQVVAALVAGVISVILGALGVKLFDKDLTWGVSALAIAVLMAVMTGLLYRGKLAFKI